MPASAPALRTEGCQVVSSAPVPLAAILARPYAGGRRRSGTVRRRRPLASSSAGQRPHGGVASVPLPVALGFHGRTAPVAL